MVSIAKKIGKVLAYLQDTIDVMMGWMFHQLKKNANTEHGKHPLKKSIKTTLSFIGHIGDSFYREYEELKKRRNK